MNHIDFTVLCGASVFSISVYMCLHRWREKKKGELKFLSLQSLVLPHCYHIYFFEYAYKKKIVCVFFEVVKKPSNDLGNYLFFQLKTNQRPGKIRT